MFRLGIIEESLNSKDILDLVKPYLLLNPKSGIMK